MNARTSRNRAIVERVAVSASPRTVAREFGITFQRDSQIHLHITGERLRLGRTDAEQEAQQTRRGLWGLPEAERMPPWEWRAAGRACQER
jgi:hypothetical protein